MDKVHAQTNTCSIALPLWFFIRLFIDLIVNIRSEDYSNDAFLRTLRCLQMFGYLTMTQFCGRFFFLLLSATLIFISSSLQLFHGTLMLGLSSSFRNEE